MQYRKDKKGNEISLLGYGCMRFTRKGGGIDLDKAEREVMAAIQGGVNYLDTAYIYPGNEAAVGEILRRTGCIWPPSCPTTSSNPPPARKKSSGKSSAAWGRTMWTTT